MDETVSGFEAAEAARALSAHRLDLLGGLFRASDEAARAVGGALREETGIGLREIGARALSEEEWGRLRAFEFAHQSALLRGWRDACAGPPSGTGGGRAPIPRGASRGAAGAGPASRGLPARAADLGAGILLGLSLAVLFQALRGRSEGER